jgi:hypothetical protein
MRTIRALVGPGSRSRASGTLARVLPTTFVWSRLRGETWFGSSLFGAMWFGAICSPGAGCGR